MKLRNLSLLLFAAACGGGKDPDPVPLDTPTGDGGGFFPNSRNDVVLVTFPEEGSGLSFTPDTTDEPDNTASPLEIDTQSGGFKIAAESGIAGDHSDEYFERDSFLIHTGATTNQLTVRLQWDGNASDHDYFILEEESVDPTAPIAIASGTLISNGVDDDGTTPVPEFATFVVEPNHNYVVWSGVYQENADPGGEPSLPSPYDFSIFGDAVDTTTVAGTCTITEANDLQNNGIVVFGGDQADRQGNTTIDAGAKLFCGSLNGGHFTLTPDADDDPTLGTDDVDAFGINIALDGDLLVQIVGETAADQTAINAFAANGLLAVALFNDACVNGGANQQCTDVDNMTAGVQPRPQQFFTTSEVDYVLTHGVTAFRMIASNTASTTAGQEFDIVGPKTLAVFLQSNMPGVLAANQTIKYRVKVSVDNRNTRAPRIAGAASLTEANDN